MKKSTTDRKPRPKQKSASRSRQSQRGHAHELDTAIAGLVAEAERLAEDPAALRSAFEERFLDLPDEAVAMLCARLSAHDSAVCRSLALWWLLDEDPRIQDAALAGLTEQAANGRLDSQDRQGLSLVAALLPEGTLRSAVERLSADYPPADDRPEPDAVRRILTSPPDGGGAMSLSVLMEQGGRYTVGLVLLKVGIGVPDALTIPDQSKAEAQSLLENLSEETGARAVDRETAMRLLGDILGHGMANGDTPAPGILDVFLAAGLPAPRPKALTADDWLAVLDPDGTIETIAEAEREAAIAASANWGERLQTFDSWVLDPDSLPADADSEAEVGKAVWDELAFARETWVLQFLRTAQVLRDAEGEDNEDTVRSLVVTARAMMAGRPLEDIPIMQHVAEQSIAFAMEDPMSQEERFHEAITAWRDSIPRDALIATCAARGGDAIAPEFEEGFLSALVVAPEGTTPQEWVSSLCTGLSDEMEEVESRALIQAALGRMLQVGNAINEGRTDLRLDTARAWCAGFTAALDRLPDLWTRDRRSAADRRHILLAKEMAKRPATAKEVEAVAAWLVKLGPRP